MTTQAEIETLRERLMWDTPFFARHCLWIVNKQRRPQPLEPLPWQARTEETPAHVTPLDEAMERQRAAGLPVRIIIGKARKLGMSTWVQGKFFQRVSQHSFQNALTVCHRADATDDLANMADLMYDRLPTNQQLAELIYGEGTSQAAPFSVRPHRFKHDQRRGIRTMELGEKRRPSEKSIYRTMTAGSKGGGRAGTPNLIHASEFAHYENPDYGVGLFNAMPLEPETIGVIESTANGFNHFADLWEIAVRGAEDPETGAIWVPLFYGWQDNPRNALPFPTDAARERFERTIGDKDGGGDEEEVMLVEQYGVALEQLYWRRTIINGPEARGSVDWFHQEHPTTPEQMFIGSGRPVFPGILVARAIKGAQEAPAPVEGVLKGWDWQERKTRAGTVLVPQSVLWVPRDQMDDDDRDRWGATHAMKVWQHPLNEVTQSGLPRDRRKPDGQYVVAVDIATGEGETTDGEDYSAIQVIDHLTLMQVASYRSRIPIHDLPLLVYMVALYYNEAWLAVEVNNMGVGTVDALAKDYRYRLLYRRRRAGDDERSDTRERLLGWNTDRRTKPLLEQTFGQALREETHGLRCVATAREFSTYVADPKNPANHGAQKGAHDDLLMSYMIAQRVASEMRPRDPGKRRLRDRWAPQDDVVGY